MDYFEGNTNPSTSLIFNSDVEKMITLDHNQKTYFIMDKETMTEISNQMNSAMIQMEEAMKGMSAEEKEMMKNMMELEGSEDITPEKMFSYYTDEYLK